MKILIDRDNLQKILAVVSRVIGKGSNIPPILRDLHIEVQKNCLILTANNLETEIRGRCFAEADGQGSIVAPAKLVEIVKSLPGPEVEMVVEGLQVSIKSGGTSFVLHGIDPEEFPILENKEPKIEFILSNLDEIAAKTLFVTNQSDVGFRCGVSFWCQDGKLACAATDTYRLAEFLTPLRGEFQILLLGKSLAAAAAAFKDKEVTCRVYDNSIEFQDETYSVNCRLLEDKFPNYSRIWPGEHKTTVTVSLEWEWLRAALSRALLLSPPSNNMVEVAVKGNVMEISTTSEIGSIHERFDVEKAGEDVVAYWNAKYLLEGLVAAGKSAMHFNGEAGPCVIEADSYRYLVLPIKKERKNKCLKSCV